MIHVPGQHRRVASYLVALDQVVISQDIAGAIGEHSPGARVLVARNASEALAMLEPVAQLSVAFLGMPPRHYADSDLARAIAARRGKAVLISPEAEEAAPSTEWRVLELPFTTEAVHAMLGPGTPRLRLA